MNHSKIAVISDIHANVKALYKFINYLEQEEINLVLNLGDFISNGPNPCEVFDIIINDSRFINIMGYDEENIFNSSKIDEGIGQGRWLRDKLGKERLSKLRKIPSTKSLTINGKNILLCHHNGWSQIEQVVAHSKVLKQDKYDFLLCGGTHLQELSHSRRHYAHTHIIDPGTLGDGKNEKGYFAIINFEEKEPMIHFQSIDIKQGIQEEGTKQVNDVILNKKVEEQLKLKDAFLYIQGPSQNKDGIMYINDKIVERIIEIGIRECKYISIGCWSNEHQLIREILYHLKCRTIKSSESDGQQWYIGEITEDVINLLLEKRNLPCGRLKWFELSFQNRVEDASPLYSIFNYGKKGFLRRLSQRDLYTVEEMLKKYNLEYTLPEE